MKTSDLLSAIFIIIVFIVFFITKKVLGVLSNVSRYLYKRYLEQFGINPKRAKYIFVSASEGVFLTETAKEYSEEIKELGPNPIRGGN